MKRREKPRIWRWLETTQEKYHEQLEIVPPARAEKHGFAVGEPLLHDEDEYPIHQIYVYCCSRYFTRPAPLWGFSINRYVKEIVEEFHLQQSRSPDTAPRPERSRADDFAA